MMSDEFAVLLPETDVFSAPRIAKRVIEVLEVAIHLDREQVTIGASIGIAIYPAHADDAATLLRRADLAMYAAKRTRSGVCLFAPEHDEPSAERLTLIGSLCHAIERHQLVLEYQPVADCETGGVRSLEALVCWQHLQEGLLLPERFIPFAEETGLIRPLTRWVLESALQQCRAWHDAGLQLAVGVNLSTHDVHDRTLPETIAQMLAQAGLEPRWLKLELTESALLVDGETALSVLARLCEMGCDVAVDDFGTGYSSLTYLTTLPARQLKIDASFVQAMSHNSREAAVVRSTIELGHTLGLVVVAEGVEDPCTLGVLRPLGCDQVQGYSLSQPLSGEQVLQWCLQHDARQQRPPA